METNEIKSQQTLPNSTGVLVLGILSIACCWCYGLFGVIFGIISLVMASKGRQLYNEHPEFYTESSFKNMNAGKICAIIGLSISGVYLLIVMFYLIIVGTALTAIFSNVPWHDIFNY